MLTVTRRLSVVDNRTDTRRPITSACKYGAGGRTTTGMLDPDKAVDEELPTLSCAIRFHPVQIVASHLHRPPYSS